MPYKVDKINVAILKNVSDILQFEVKNPEIGFVTVTRVETTRDYSYSKIYVSFLDNKNADKRMEALEKTKGFIRSELAKRLTIYKCPSLIFVKDTAYEEGQKIENILNGLKK